MQEKQELLIPKTDVVFHSLFRTGNEDITKLIVQDIIQEKIKTINLEMDRYLIKKYTEDKLGILDLKARLNEGTLCNIEIQLSDKGNIIKRILWYWSKVYSGQLKEKEDYNKLEKTICIVIIDFELNEIPELRELEDCHTKWQIKESKREKILLTDLLEIHIIEIPKAKRLLKKEPKNKIIQWMAFLDNPNEMEVLEMAKQNKGIKKAMEKLKEISKDDKLRRIAELREKAILDERSAINYATEKGREEGKKETAKKLKEKNMPTEEIEEITGLTKEEIEKL